MIKSSSSGRHYEFHCLITDETSELIFGKKHYHSIWPGASKVMTSFAVTYAAQISREYTVTTAIPKLHRSNLIEMKKNKTVSWFEQLPKDNEHCSTGNSEKVNCCKAVQGRGSQQRREKMAQEKRKRDAQRKRAEEDRERLAGLHLIKRAQGGPL